MESPWPGKAWHGAAGLGKGQWNPFRLAFIKSQWKRRDLACSGAAWPGAARAGRSQYLASVFQPKEINMDKAVSRLLNKQRDPAMAVAVDRCIAHLRGMKHGETIKYTLLEAISGIKRHIVRGGYLVRNPKWQGLVNHIKHDAKRITEPTTEATIGAFVLWHRHSDTYTILQHADVGRIAVQKRAKRAHGQFRRAKEEACTVDIGALTDTERTNHAFMLQKLDAVNSDVERERRLIAAMLKRPD